MEKKVKKEMEAVTEELKKTIKEEQERGASLGSLQKEGDKLNKNLSVFAESSSRAEKRLWWKSVKWMAIVGGIVGVFVLIVVYKIFKG